MRCLTGCDLWQGDCFHDQFRPIAQYPSCELNLCMHPQRGSMRLPL